jgi:hypothetical protein
MPPKSSTQFGGIFMEIKIKYNYEFKLRCVKSLKKPHESKLLFILL